MPPIFCSPADRWSIVCAFPSTKSCSCSRALSDGFSTKSQSSFVNLRTRVWCSAWASQGLGSTRHTWGCMRHRLPSAKSIKRMIKTQTLKCQCTPIRSANSMTSGCDSEKIMLHLYVFMAHVGEIMYKKYAKNLTPYCANTCIWEIASLI